MAMLLVYSQKLSNYVLIYMYVLLLQYNRILLLYAFCMLINATQCTFRGGSTYN